MLARILAGYLMRLVPLSGVAVLSASAIAENGSARDAISLAEMDARPLPRDGKTAAGAQSPDGSILTLPHVANTEALMHLASTTQARIVRDGFAASGDGGRAEYVLTAKTCPLNGGAGDGGSQIGLRGTRSTYIGCALIDWASVGGAATPELFGGAVGYPNARTTNSGLVDAQPAIQAAANTGRPVQLSGAEYLVSTCVLLTTPSQSIRGIGRDATVISAPA